MHLHSNSRLLLQQQQQYYEIWLGYCIMYSFVQNLAQACRCRLKFKSPGEAKIQRCSYTATAAVWVLPSKLIQLCMHTTVCIASTSCKYASLVHHALLGCMREYELQYAQQRRVLLESSYSRVVLLQYTRSSLLCAYAYILLAQQLVIYIHIMHTAPNDSTDNRLFKRNK